MSGKCELQDRKLAQIKLFLPEAWASGLVLTATNPAILTVLHDERDRSRMGKDVKFVFVGSLSIPPAPPFLELGVELLEVIQLHLVLGALPGGFNELSELGIPRSDTQGGRGLTSRELPFEVQFRD